MKTLFQILTCCLIVTQIYAQPSNTNSKKNNTEWMTFKATEQQSAAELIQDKATLKLNTDDKLTLLSVVNDPLGYQHYRYQQSYKGIPIEGAIYLLHEKNASVKQANGQLVRELNLNTIPSISVDAALPLALQHIDAQLYAWNDPAHEHNIKHAKNREDATFYPVGELVIINPASRQETPNYRLAYKFDIYAVEPLTRKLVYVDAHTSTILTTVEKIHNCTDADAFATTNYSGDRSFVACRTDGISYTLKNNTGGGMQVFNSNNTQSFPQIHFTSPDFNFNTDPTANEVHWATQKTYQYFLNTHGRSSLDGDNMALYSWVHYDNDYNNAFWNGSWMTYGDGDGITFSSLTAPDVVAHEMVHGITEFSAGLEYSYESGALNESFSDIFGEVAERYMRGNNDWLLGADFTVRSGKTTLRNISNPNAPNAITQQPDTYHGDYWYFGDGDNGGVHYNSGVQNYWFYLLSQGGSGINDNGDAYNVSGIGMAKAADIAYLNLTAYLTQTSEYADAREGAIQAAIDIYGATSNEVLQTEAAWCAVGLGTCSMPPLSCRQSDSLALVTLYNATSGANWTNTWDLNQPMDTWYGIALNGDGCVTEIDLFNRSLIGNIPSELGSLSSLTHLSLRENQLSGNIPPELGNLGNLDSLSLSHNQLSSNIPPELGNLDKLKYLHLNSNELSGNILRELGNLSNLEGLFLSNNQLSGSIPPELGNLNNLEKLYLYSNQLSGCYDVNLINLCSQLTDFLITNNNFDATWENFCLSGVGSCTPIPPPESCNRESDSLALVALYNATNGPNWTNTWDLSQPMDTWHGVWDVENDCIIRLHLSNNQLVGNIPPEIGNLGGIEYLALSGNQLTGSIPPEIGNLTKLEYLHLEENQLTGNIPAEIGNLSNLNNLNLKENQLNGSIPIEIGNLSNLVNLTLYSNQLSGSIPFQIGNLSNLSGLWLWGNQLSGSIPPEIGNLTNLERLFLHDNQLSGDIPPELGNLSNLIILFLSDNQLTGSIPPEFGNLSDLITLFLSDNQLTGSIPSELGNLSNLERLSLYLNQLTGSIPSELGNLSNLSELRLNNNALTGCYDTNLSNLCSQLDIVFTAGGNQFDATWEDFCAIGAGDCTLGDVPPVWPGDFNTDGIVDIQDLLYWGVAEGFDGTARPNATFNWIPQDCQEWAHSVNDVNSKHQDGDGDGIVNSNDINALIQNYGNTTTVVPTTFASSPLQFKLETVSHTSENGTITTAYDLYVESSLGTPVAAHGLACSIDFGGLPINEVSFDFTNSALEPSEYLDIYDATQNTIHLAFTRTDKINQICNGPIARGIVVMDDLQAGSPFVFGINQGKTMSSNGILTSVGGSTQVGFLPEVSIFEDFSASVSATYNQCNDAGEALAEAINGTPPYNYTWSTGETTQQISGLSIGTYRVTVADANSSSKVIDFETEWAFTPVEVTTSSTQICINFDNAPLAEAVQVSLDNGATYKSPIMANTCYNTAAGTHHVWIQRVADQCPVDLGTVTVSGGGGGCTSRKADANLVAIGSNFGQFANEEFIKNFLTAEKDYIKYQAEIHRILESKDARYTKVNEDFDKIKDMAMTMLFQSFVSKRPLTVSEEHIKAIDNFLLSLSQATSKGKLRNEIVKVRQHLHVMESKEVKDALIAFDRAGATDTSEITPFDTSEQDQFDVQLLNTAGRESRVTYNIVKQGIVNMSLYNTHGQQVMTLYNGISYTGHHQIPIDKNGLPSGIYFIHIEYIADGIPINKIFKMAVME